MILVSGSVEVKEVKPQLSEYISDSLALLRRSPVPDDVAVHDVRVLMKKSRAAMKLVKTIVSDEAFKREYSCFREVGRMLGEWRDLSVYRKTIRILVKENKNLFLKLSGEEKINFLLKKPEVNQAITPEKISKAKEVGELLNKTLFRLRFLKLSDADAGILIKELNQTYEQVSRIYLSCRYNTKPDKIHELRKKSKDFLYQLYFFRQLNPRVIRNLEKKLDLLTQNLGRYNDLSQVLNYLEYKYDESSGNQGLNELMVVIKNKQDQYLSKVWPVGYKIFCPGKQLIDILGFRILMI
jgi:CHAD domain-containing protein